MLESNKTNKRRVQSAFINKKPQAKLINNQTRNRLKDVFINRFAQKFNESNTNPIIIKEVETFLQKEKLSENDLKLLEKNISNKLKKFQYSKNISNLKNNLNNNTNFQMANPEFVTEKNPNDYNKDLNTSEMSGGSDIEKFDNRYQTAELTQEDINKYKKSKNKPSTLVPQANIDYSKYADEWDAINMYNKKEFEKQKKLEKIKDKQIKNRVKTDLDDQIKEKIKKEYEKELKSQEYDKLFSNHLKHLDELEKEKEKKVKALILEEKKVREKQIIEKNKINRIKDLKKIQYERELIAQNKKDILEDKKAAKEKKIAEKIAMDKTMKDNELRKQILAEQAKKEREDDIQMLKDHAATEIKKENERKAYYNRIQRNANSFMDNAVQGILREQQEKDREDEEKLNNFIQNKYKQEDEDEYKRLKKIHDDKINLRKYYDNQIKEKKLLEKYEKDIDKVQADIWKKDEQMYIENEKEVNKIIKDMYKRNLKALDELVQNKKKDNFVGMSENEKAMNRDLIQKAYQDDNDEDNI